MVWYDRIAHDCVWYAMVCHDMTLTWREALEAPSEHGKLFAIDNQKKIGARGAKPKHISRQQVNTAIAIKQHIMSDRQAEAPWFGITTVVVLGITVAGYCTVQPLHLQTLPLAQAPSGTCLNCCLSAMPQCSRMGKFRHPLTTHALTTGFGRFD